MENVIKELPCELIVREGVSKKTNKPYRMTILRVYTEYGEYDVVLDTRTDRAGIVLDMIARKEGN